MRMKRDPLPLFINIDYLKEPRYFSLSFRSFFQKVFEKSELDVGIHEIKLSKPETVEIFDGGTFNKDKIVENIFYVKSDLATKEETEFTKEVYVRGNTVIGENNKLRALACDGEVKIGAGTLINRWVDAEGKVDIAEGCNLGISITTGNELHVKNDCKFKRLYGTPVTTGRNKQIKTVENLHECEVYKPTEQSLDIKEIAENTINDFSIITAHDLKVGTNSRINGHIKAYKSVVIEENVIITGNIFADGDIRIGKNSTVLGNVFSQDEVILDSMVTIGQEGKIKSVIGNSSILLAGGVTVHGYVSTDGDGIVL